jgi:hypothetical protein
VARILRIAWTIQAVLADPVSEASGITGFEQFVAFVRNAVYR